MQKVKVEDFVRREPHKVELAQDQIAVIPWSQNTAAPSYRVVEGGANFDAGPGMYYCILDEGESLELKRTEAKVFDCDTGKRRSVTDRVTNQSGKAEVKERVRTGSWSDFDPSY